MKKILNTEEAINIARELRNKGKTVVVVGGFFDILHLGHIEFLKESKKYGDCLFVLLEEDSKAAKDKGIQRPINSQEHRAKILSSLESVDYIVILKNMTNDQLYDKLMIEMQPSVISTTYGDSHIDHKIRQAKLIGAKVVYSIKRLGNHSTTKYIKHIKNN